MSSTDFFRVPSGLLDRLGESSPLILTGSPAGSRSLVVSELFRSARAPLILVTKDDLEAEGLLADLEAWTSLWPDTERPGLFYLPELDEGLRVAALGGWSQE